MSGATPPASPTAPDARRTEAGASNHAAQRNGKSAHKRSAADSPSAPPPKAGLTRVQLRDVLRAVDFLKERGEPKLAAAVLALNQAVERKLHDDGFKAVADWAIRHADAFENPADAIAAAEAIKKAYNRDKAMGRIRTTNKESA